MCCLKNNYAAELPLQLLLVPLLLVQLLMSGTTAVQHSVLADHDELCSPTSRWGAVSRCTARVRVFVSAELACCSLR